MDYDKIADRLRRIDKNAEAELLKKIDLAKAEVERLKNLFLKTDPALKSLYLFGSLADGKVTNSKFDIDMAVDSKNYLSLVSACENSPIKVDLIDLNTARTAIKKSILEGGVLLYEKK